MKVSVFMVSVVDTGSELETEIGTSATSDEQRLWYLVLSNLRIALEIEQTVKRIGKIV